MVRTLAPALAGSFFVALFVGCATARVVSVQPGQGGVIAVSPAHSEDSRQKAETLMRRNCGGWPFKILSEDEAVVGQQTYHAVDQSSAKYWNASSHTSDETEWRLRYKCE